MSAPCGCTAVWGWSPARKSFWSAGGITYDASLEFGTCAHRNVLQRPDTNFRMLRVRAEGRLPGKEPVACDHVAVWVSDHHWTIQGSRVPPFGMGTLSPAVPGCSCPGCGAVVMKPERGPNKDPSAFYMSVSAEAGKQYAPPEMAIEYTMTAETPPHEKHVLPRAPSSDRGWTRAEFASKVLPDDEVLVAARGQKWAVGEGINPGQVAQGVWVTTPRGERRVLIMAGIHPGVPYTGYVTVKVLHRSGDVRTSMHCTECGAGEGELHRGGEGKCMGLQRMREHHGLKPIEAGYSCLDAVKETRLRPYKSELAVMMVDDMSEPP